MKDLANGTYFITGIDTDAGKSYATGILARRMLDDGRSVITQKFIQTGCEKLSEDIETHRRIMGVPLLDIDIDGTTCPEVFRFAASPHLAAKLENRQVDLAKIEKSTQILEASYDIVLIEGAGGLMVPINGDYTTADYVKTRNLPLIIVTSPRLGSINHTLLTLEVCKSRGIDIAAIVYNHYPANNEIIRQDTFSYICEYIHKHHPNTKIYETEIIA